MAKLKIKRKTSKIVKGGYTKYGFLCVNQEGEEEWINAFSNATSDKWDEGDVIDHEFTSREYNGKQYYDFKFERNTPAGSAGNKIEEKLDLIISLLKGKDELPPPPHRDEDKPWDDGDESEIPF